MIDIKLKKIPQNSYCPICFSIINKNNFDKHLDEKHPRTGYVSKGNVPLFVSRHALDYLCPDCFLTYESLEKLKEHFLLMHHFSIKEEEIHKENPIKNTNEHKINARQVSIADSSPKVPIEKNISDFSLYVYDALTPTRCIGGTVHNAENVTLETKTSNGISVSFNVFYCSKCGKYYTNIKALERKFPLHNFPLIRMHFESFYSYEKRAYSDLALYGYTARAGALMEYERQNILIRVMVNNFLTKKKIIGLLQGFINYNGRASHMGNAVKIWETDIDFVSKFRIEFQNKIKADTVKIIYKGKKQ